MEKIEIQHRMRFQPTGMQIREREDGEESREVTGCAIVYNQETTLWDGQHTRYREIILPSCVDDQFLAEQDIKLNIMHQRSMTLARNNKGVGTLRLENREDGLYFTAEMPKCDMGDMVLELIKNRTLTGCSFEFWASEYDDEYTTLPDGREDCLTKHKRFKAIDALTIAMDPAYEQTSVDLREQMEKREADCAKRAMEREEAKKREQADAEKLTRERSLRELQSDIDAERALMNRK